MSVLSARFCSNHPELHAVAICMSCREQLCSDCATTFEGINYCSSCFAERAGGSAERSSRLGVVVTLLLGVVLSFVATRVFVAMGVVLARVFAE